MPILAPELKPDPVGVGEGAGVDVLMEVVEEFVLEAPARSTPGLKGCVSNTDKSEDCHRTCTAYAQEDVVL